MSETAAAPAGPAAQFVAFVVAWSVHFFAVDLGPAFDYVQDVVARWAAFVVKVAKWAAVVAAVVGATAAGGAVAAAVPAPVAAVLAA